MLYPVVEKAVIELALASAAVSFEKIC